MFTPSTSLGGVRRRRNPGRRSSGFRVASVECQMHVWYLALYWDVRLMTQDLGLGLRALGCRVSDLRSSTEGNFARLDQLSSAFTCTQQITTTGTESRIAAGVVTGAESKSQTRLLIMFPLPDPNAIQVFQTFFPVLQESFGSTKKK